MHIDDGETPRQAALIATNDIGLTVTAGTFTAVAVFLPIGLMGGVVGQFFKPFGINVSAGMLTSLLVARTLSPPLYWQFIGSNPQNLTLLCKKISLGADSTKFTTTCSPGH